MTIALHKNARTTPAIRAEIAASADSVAVLAARYNVGEGTIRRWKIRSVFTDASHTAHRLQTTLTPAQEAILVELRKMLLLPLNDLLAVRYLAQGLIAACAATAWATQGFAACHPRRACQGLQSL